MIVYGDPSFETTLEAVIGLISNRVERFDFASLDDLRALLIASGQLEQAVFDCSDASADLQGKSFALTDFAAALFQSCLASSLAPSAAADARQRFANHLRGIALSCDLELQLMVKVPEGFQFYTLYPEQYCLSAIRWSAARARPGRVLVIGVRSIGTTLSAVIARSLRRSGFAVQRLTLRPDGHPFKRQVELDPDSLERAEWVLVVDEGPGASGSSMAAVAEALAGHKYPLDQIAFLPGHGGEPGAKANDRIRFWWSRIPRFVSTGADLRWNGINVEKQLLIASSEIIATGKFESCENISSGEWRNKAFGIRSAWPPVAKPFERTKYWCANSNGGAAFWKFDGLGGFTSSRDVIVERPRLRNGFGGRCWVEGQLLARNDLAIHDRIIPLIARRILQAAGPVLGGSSRIASMKRLAEMASYNTRELLGETEAQFVGKLSGAVRTEHAVASYGDGHLAPDEWIMEPDGKIQKVCRNNCVTDHTVIGTQSHWWDVAGALVEWNFQNSSRAKLLKNGGFDVAPNELAFYEIAYCAFRAGLMKFSMENEPDVEERDRLMRASDYYRHQLTTRVRPGLHGEEAG
jgi:hypothetical protein